MSTASALDRVIVALDSMSDKEAIDFTNGPARDFKFFKVGLELYLAFGADLVHKLSRGGEARIFLDLKLHDIPNTVAGAIKSLRGLPVEFLTIHLGGGADMIERALESAQEYLPKTTLLGVSVLTSMARQDLSAVWGVDEDSEQTFERLFALAKKRKMSGLVCSPHEVTLAKKIYGHQNLTLVTPGVRFQDEIDSGAIGDQKRVLSPQEALKLGSNYLVMGRSLTKAKNIDSRILELRSMTI